LEEYVRIPVHIPPNLIMDLPWDNLPSDWNSRPAAPSIKAIGDRWAKQGKSAVLKVPSVVIPEEYNYLLSPSHPEFAKITIGNPINYRFDLRLASWER
jgi:RES domain-containing protein